MGVNSSVLKSRRFTFSSKDDSLVKRSKNFELYHALIKMGFESDSVLKACDKFKSENDMDKAINFLLSQQQHQHIKQVHTERTEMVDQFEDIDIEVDEDGYIKMKCEISTNINEGCSGSERDERTSSSFQINDEVIRFHLEAHKESIEEQRIINKMAEEYEQRQIYKEMIKKEEEEYAKECLMNIECNLQYLESAYCAQSQYLHQQYQNKIAQDTNGQNVDMINAEFERSMEVLKNNYLQQRAILDKSMNEMQKMFGKDVVESSIMGTCRSAETLELIEIRNSINKQNECIQTMMNSTKNELKDLNDKISKMERKLDTKKDEHNISSKDLEQKLVNLSSQIANGSFVGTEMDTKENLSNQANAIQKFPKPRVVKFYSENSNGRNNAFYDHNHTAKYHQNNTSIDPNDHQLNAINLRMDSMRNVIRNSMSNS